MSTQSYIHGAVYTHDGTGKRVIFEALGHRTAVVRREQDGLYEDIPHGEFTANFSDSGEHDHDTYCCTIHGTHAMPHRGCVLR